MRNKGATDNFSTRTGEGFQQEAAQAFEQTNMKNAEHQVRFLQFVLLLALLVQVQLTNSKMCIIDEKQEAIARIRMAIDNDKKVRLNLESAEDTAEDRAPLDLEPESSKTWQLGSPEGKKTNFRITAADLSKDDPCYHDLDKRLRDFIAYHIPEEAIQLRHEDDIYVSIHLPRFFWVIWKN